MKLQIFNISVIRLMDLLKPMLYRINDRYRLVLEYTYCGIVVTAIILGIYLIAILLSHTRSISDSAALSNVEKRLYLETAATNSNELFNASDLLKSLEKKYRRAIRESMNHMGKSPHTLWVIDKKNTKLIWRSFTDEPLLIKRSTDVETNYSPFQANTFSPIDFRTSHETDKLAYVRHYSNADNDQVLMVSWMASGYLFKPYVKSGENVQLVKDVWATAAPQVGDFCKNISQTYSDGPNPQFNEAAARFFPPNIYWNLFNSDGVRFGNSTIKAPLLQSMRTSFRTIRLLQYHGLPAILPTDRLWFVSFWVNPRDLFRPCLDMRISIKTCPETVVSMAQNGTTFVQIFKPDAQIEKELNENEWFRNMATNTAMYDYRSNNGWLFAFPWTRLGFAYDWGSNDKSGRGEGPTEFIIRQGATVWIDNVQHIGEMCAS